MSRLEVGYIVSVQNQTGPRAKKWDKTGIVVETRPNDQYRVKIDGTGQITLRNRQFLRKISKQGSKNLEDVKVSQPLSSEGGGREKRRHRSGKLSTVITLRQTLSI